MQSSRKRPWMFPSLHLLFLHFFFYMSYGCWRRSHCSLAWAMAQCVAPSRTALRLQHLPPALRGRRSEWVGGRKWGTEGVKAPVLGCDAPSMRAFDFCCVYTIRPAGEKGIALAKRICSLPVSLSLSALCFPLVPTLSAPRDLSAFVECRWL